jgi:hypothetical protein
VNKRLLSIKDLVWINIEDLLKEKTLGKFYG